MLHLFTRNLLTPVRMTNVKASIIKALVRVVVTMCMVSPVFLS